MQPETIGLMDMGVLCIFLRSINVGFLRPCLVLGILKLFYHMFLLFHLFCEVVDCTD